LLALAVASLIIPPGFHYFTTTTAHKITALSRATSILLLITYGCYLFFQLKSHVDIYNRPSLKVKKRHQRIGEGDASRGIAQIAGMSAASMGGENAQHIQMQNPDDEPELPQLTTLVALITLGVSTALVAICAEFMVNSIDALTATGSIGETFVGLILLPIVGNAAEHATAVTVACKDKMDLAIGVAVGSSMQIVLLVLPLMVVIGWILGIEGMVRIHAKPHPLVLEGWVIADHTNSQQTLNFDAFQIIVLFVTVLLVNYLIADGKSNWLEGVLLMVMYLIIAIATWYVVPLSLSNIGYRIDRVLMFNRFVD
jgi:Ca2+:H+ antiporter